MSIAFLALLASSSIFFVLAIPLALRKVKPNPYYGVRLSLTLKNQYNWYKINQEFGCTMIFCNFTFIATTFFFELWEEKGDNYLIVFLLFLLQFLLPIISVTLSVYKVRKRNNE